MRITGGQYRGRQIKCPPGVIRPAMDRMRESLFSILMGLDGQSFLDLFSGSGIVGIEAASRGAGPVTLVEKDFKKKFIMKENIRFVTEEINIFIMPVERFIKKCEVEFDIIYLDPPFDYRNKSEIIKLIEECRLLKKDGTLIIHLPKDEPIPEQINSLQLYDTRKYGGSHLKFYSIKQENQSD